MMDVDDEQSSPQDQELYAAHWAAYHMKTAMLRECIDTNNVASGSDLEKRLQFFSFHHHVLQLREGASDHLLNRLMTIINELVETWELNGKINVYHFCRIRQLSLMQYCLYKLKSFLNLTSLVHAPHSPQELDNRLPSVFDTALYEQTIKNLFHTYTPRVGSLSAVEQAYARQFKNSLLDIYKAPSIVDKTLLFVLFHNYQLEIYIKEVTALMRSIENEVMFVPEMPTLSSAPSATVKPQSKITEAAWTEEQKAKSGPYVTVTDSTVATPNGKHSASSVAESSVTAASHDSEATHEQSPAPKRRSKRVANVPPSPAKVPETTTTTNKPTSAVDDRAAELRSIREQALAKNAAKDPLKEALGIADSTPPATTSSPAVNKQVVEPANKRKLRPQEEPPATTAAAPSLPPRQLRSAGVPAEPLSLPMYGKPKVKTAEATKDAPATPKTATPTAKPSPASQGHKESNGRKRGRPVKGLTESRPTATTVSFDDSEDERVPKKQARNVTTPTKQKQASPTKQKPLDDISTSSEELSPKKTRNAPEYYTKKKFPVTIPKPEPHPEAEHIVGKRLKWSFEEEEALVSGIAKHGEGNWRQILDDPEFSGRFRGRTNVNLKDKCRNLKDRGVL